jgi:hypothetical protein
MFNTSRNIVEHVVMFSKGRKMLTRKYFNFYTKYLFTIQIANIIKSAKVIVYLYCKWVYFGSCNKIQTFWEIKMIAFWRHKTILKCIVHKVNHIYQVNIQSCQWYVVVIIKSYEKRKEERTQLAKDDINSLNSFYPVLQYI